MESARLADLDILKLWLMLCDWLLKADADSFWLADLLCVMLTERERERLALMLCDMNALRDSSRLAERERLNDCERLCE